MSALRSLAMGSTLGWCCITASTIASGTTNVGTLAAAILPTTLWTLAFLFERRRTMRMGAAMPAPVED